MNNWADKLDDELIEKNQLNIINIPAAKQNFIFWLKASLVNRFLTYFNPSWLPIKYVAYASNKRSWQLMQYLKGINFSYNHIEAHTLGALYPAYNWAKKSGKLFTFDVEDFHPEEKITFQPVREKQRRIRLMKHLLIEAKLVTAASPLIAETTSKLIKKNVITINNSFFYDEFFKPNFNLTYDKVKLIWFSITISYGRGLEELIVACQNIRASIQLDLIGNVDKKFYDEFILPNLDFISIIEPIPQNELHQKLRDYDVGLALEMASADFNRNICLTNKLFAYAQSGLYIMATDTAAQKQFLSKYSLLGKVCEQNNESMERLLLKICDDIEKIRFSKLNRFDFAKKISFEEEMKKIDFA
tara:strand:- start:4148 stop:5221 length:1074 start_codon:yes stop_codon:yes gene_type:complete